ncbi:hypothetical protein MWU52_14595 [Jannaschia sp. S6380]|uniref:hypothetical protein n=1 Tax=Jannaschia sp. S6380 TaxID=2926408 RepID=UPI001FF474D9|nr:hypothetical protein [Jannaschia sp. S6380]MCK0168785.1 hypothetical protein [Jannaschia sp. S6380]
MTTAIPALRPIEAMTFDQRKLARICDERAEGAEAFLTEVLTEIEMLIRTARHQCDDRRGLSRSCRRIVELTDTIGMETMHRAAASVMDCLAAHDARALPACHARLMRLGDPRAPRAWASGPSRRPDGAA